VRSRSERGGEGGGREGGRRVLERWPRELRRSRVADRGASESIPGRGPPNIPLFRVLRPRASATPPRRAGAPGALPLLEG